MKDYHFEKDDKDFGQTIRLDDINEELKKLENDPREDELGDKNDFLKAFQSETFHNSSHSPHSPGEKEEPFLEPNKEGDRSREQRKRRKAGGGRIQFSKRGKGILAGICLALIILILLLVKGCSADEKSPPVISEERPMVIQGVLDGGALVVYDIVFDTNKSVFVTEETAITDKEGKVLSETELKVGDLVMVRQDESEQFAATIAFSNKIQEVEATELTVDTQAKVLAGENRSFAYDKRTLFLYNGEQIEPKELEPCDVLLLKGFEDEVWVVEVLEYHGYILVENKGEIQNGKFKLDEEEALPLSEVTRIAVKEGAHTITVTGDNIEERTDSVFVTTGEEMIYDLSKTQEKVGALTVNVNTTDYKLYVNGALVDGSKATYLPYGDYDLVILKSGYMEWNKRITLKGATLTVQADLQKELQYGKLSVSANVEGASVSADGKALGTAPLTVDLPLGSYQIEVSKSGYATYVTSVMVSGSSTNVAIELVPISEVEMPRGHETEAVE